MSNIEVSTTWQKIAAAGSGSGTIMCIRPRLVLLEWSTVQPPVEKFGHALHKNFSENFNMNGEKSLWVRSLGRGLVNVTRYGPISEDSALPNMGRITSDQELEPYSRTLVNTSDGAVTLTLPQPIDDGMFVVVSHIGENMLTVAPFGNETVDLDPSGIAISKSGAELTFRYDLGTNNWELSGSPLL